MGPRRACVVLPSSSSGIQPPTKMANPSLESYIYALDYHLQTKLSVRLDFRTQFSQNCQFPISSTDSFAENYCNYCRQRPELSIADSTSQLGGLGAELWSPEKVTH
jgi:hypothetical protein